MTSALDTTLILALFAVMALRPPMPRRSSPFNLQFALGWWINEQPFLGLWWLLAGTMGTLMHPDSGLWWWPVTGFSPPWTRCCWRGSRIAPGPPARRFRPRFEPPTGLADCPSTRGRRGGGSCCCRSSRGVRTCAACATAGTGRLGAGTDSMCTSPAGTAGPERRCSSTSTGAAFGWAARCSAPAR